MLIILVCKIYYWINKVPLFWLACSTGYWNTDVLIIKILLCWLACSMGYWKTNVLITKLLLFWLVGKRCCWKMSTLIHCEQIILILWPADCLIPLTIWLVDCLIYLTVWFVWFVWLSYCLICLILLISDNQLSDNQLNSYSGSLLLLSTDIQYTIQPAIVCTVYQHFQIYRKPGIGFIRNSVSEVQLQQTFSNAVVAIIRHSSWSESLVFQLLSCYYK